MDRTQSAKGNLKEIHDRIIYDILQHFKALMNLATTLGPRLPMGKKARGGDDSDDAESEADDEDDDEGRRQAEGDEEQGPTRPENVAVVRLAMKQEFDALYTQFKELLAMNRRMKELWTFGRLGREDPEQRAKEEQLEEDVRRARGVLRMVEEMNLGGLAEGFGGRWEVGEEETGGANGSNANGSNAAPPPATATS